MVLIFADRSRLPLELRSRHVGCEVLSKRSAGRSLRWLLAIVIGEVGRDDICSVLSAGEGSRTMTFQRFRRTPLT